MNRERSRLLTDIFWIESDESIDGSKEHATIRSFQGRGKIKLIRRQTIGLGRETHDGLGLGTIAKQTLTGTYPQVSALVFLYTTDGALRQNLTLNRMNRAIKCHVL